MKNNGVPAHLASKADIVLACQVIDCLTKIGKTGNCQRFVIIDKAMKI